jgi:secreted trypsin-like serine protease
LVAQRRSVQLNVAPLSKGNPKNDTQKDERQDLYDGGDRPCFHQPSTTHFSAGGERNQKQWVFEYVELRTYAMTLRSVGDPLNIPISGRIVGGVVAGAADNPFQVGLMDKADPNNFNAQYCGGTLIQPNVVVTAAHCSDFVRAGQVQVLTGTRKLDGSGSRRDVSQIVVHPKWNPDTFDYDVAVWKLSSSASNITLATLATSDGSVGADLLATGWGALKEGGNFPVDLRKVSVPLVAGSNCNDGNSYNGAITERMICAGLDAGGRDTCQGDSGGPITRGSGNTVLTGITSWGRGCARKDLFGVYTRISNSEVRSFIESND